MAAQTLSHTQHKPLEVLIIGGSLAGLMAGVLLKRKGHNVRIIEQAKTSQREGMAAGVGFTSHVRLFFETEDRLEDHIIGMTNDDFLVVNDQLNVKYTIKAMMRMTTWDTGYYRLRANFDRLKSSYCPQPPAENTDGTEGEAVFETGKRVTRVADVDGRMTVFAEDVITNNTEQYQGDIVIAADGANSNIRRILNPDLQREEPGYAIWRGVIPTSEVSKELLDKIETKAIVWPGKYNYCLIYTIPGHNGSLLPGERHINFVWYFWPTTPSISEIMTDTSGHQHRSTVPKGQLRPEIWEAQIAQARLSLPKEFVELVEHIREPFVSLISSVSTPRAAYFDDRLFLIGDALTQLQPNTGMGTNMAALGATTLANLIGPAGKGPLDEREVREWEGSMLRETELERVRSTAFASWFLDGWLRMGWFYARWWWVFYRQRWFGV